jgi:hypothetical protein
MSKDVEALCHRDIRMMGALGRAMAVLEAQFLFTKKRVEPGLLP